MARRFKARSRSLNSRNQKPIRKEILGLLIFATFFKKIITLAKLFSIVLVTYREPGTPDLPIRGVFSPEEKTDVPHGDRPIDKTGDISPESIGGFGGVDMGSGTILEGIGSPKFPSGIPQCTSDNELFKFSPSGARFAERCVNVFKVLSPESTKPDSFLCPEFSTVRN